MFDTTLGWYGYADAKPSESIQNHELPGLSVAVVFPHMPGEEIVQPPIRQYKDYSRRQKALSARRLIDWLIAQREQGLALVGFIHAHSQASAAELGLELIEELPNTRVEPHYDTYRLFFEDEHVDFAQAVALEYYFLTMSLGILRAGTKILPESRKLFVAMDRFPGADTNDANPGASLPKTQGAKFIEFIQKNSKTGKGLLNENKSINLESNFGNLDWWKWKSEDNWKEGKGHPHFVLPDWLAAAALVHEFREDYIATFPNHEKGTEAAEALDELYTVFKSFHLWSIQGNSLSYIKAEEKLWTVPENARRFIMSRAQQHEN